MSSESSMQALFMGNPNWHGADWGQAVPEPPDWVAHLHNSGSAIGVYPMWAVPTVVGASWPHEHEWLVRWGCIDLDVKREGKRRWDYDTEQDAHTAAVNLRLVFDQFGIVSWIEVTKSHGRHVWVFAKEPVPAATMRRALLVACMVAEVPPTEVNPKSEGFDDPNTLGNYVRTMYPGGRYDDCTVESRELGVAGWCVGGRGLVLRGLANGGSHGKGTDQPPNDGRGCRDEGEGDCRSGRAAELRSSLPEGGRQVRLRGEGHLSLEGPSGARRDGSVLGVVAVDGHTPTWADRKLPDRVAVNPEGQAICRTCFLTLALAHRTPRALLDTMADLYVPPAPSRVVLSGDGTYDGELNDNITPYIRTVLENGPTEEGRDRSGWLWWLAGKCLNEELSPECALDVLVAADETWTQKYTNRKDGASRLVQIIEKVYA